MKKLMIIGLVLLLMGCNSVNEVINNTKPWEKEKEYCSNGNKIWVLERRSSRGISITSQIVGKCEEK